MNPYRCPLCFARDVDVVFLQHDAVRDEHYCLQCAYAAPSAEVERLLALYRNARYKLRTRAHPFASRPEGRQRTPRAETPESFSPRPRE